MTNRSGLAAILRKIERPAGQDCMLNSTMRARARHTMGSAARVSRRPNHFMKVSTELNASAHSMHTPKLARMIGSDQPASDC